MTQVSLRFLILYFPLIHYPSLITSVNDASRAYNSNIRLRSVFSLIFLGGKLKNDYFCTYESMFGFGTANITTFPLTANEIVLKTSLFLLGMI